MAETGSIDVQESCQFSERYTKSNNEGKGNEHFSVLGYTWTYVHFCWALQLTHFT